MMYKEKRNNTFSDICRFHKCYNVREFILIQFILISQYFVYIIIISIRIVTINFKILTI